MFQHHQPCFLGFSSDSFCCRSCGRSSTTDSATFWPHQDKLLTTTSYYFLHTFRLSWEIQSIYAIPNIQNMNFMVPLIKYLWSATSWWLFATHVDPWLTHHCLYHWSQTNPATAPDIYGAMIPFEAKIYMYIIIIWQCITLFDNVSSIYKYIYIYTIFIYCIYLIRGQQRIFVSAVAYLLCSCRHRFIQLGLLRGPQGHDVTTWRRGRWTFLKPTKMPNRCGNMVTMNIMVRLSKTGWCHVFWMSPPWN